MNPYHAILVFGTACVADVFWARWSIESAKKHAGRAAFWGAWIVLIGVVNIDAYIDSRWYVIPAALGAALGTYVAVRRPDRQEVLDVSPDRSV